MSENVLWGCDNVLQMLIVEFGKIWEEKQFCYFFANKKLKLFFSGDLSLLDLPMLKTRFG